MNDPRFLPIENREPIEEYDDEFLDEPEEELDELMPVRRKGRKLPGTETLYMAS